MPLTHDPLCCKLRVLWNVEYRQITANDCVHLHKENIELGVMTTESTYLSQIIELSVKLLLLKKGLCEKYNQFLLIYLINHSEHSHVDYEKNVVILSLQRQM